MEIFNTKSSLRAHLDRLKASSKIGFIPTMGALHQGHISLIEEAKKHADLTVCSIFVNPTQFNDPKDLEKYPRPIEQDISLLEQAKCDILFLPSVEEIYPDPNEQWHVDLGQLDQIWEGEHRPGHFQGVTQVVYKLFQIVQPDIACFGQKDFQQVMVIQSMIDSKKLDIKLIICPIKRNDNGLALSSRNVRLSGIGKQKALVLFRALQATADCFGTLALSELQQQAEQIIQAEEGVTLEYFAICETTTLERASSIIVGNNYVALVVAWIEGVRLIDNMLLYQANG